MFSAFLSRLFRSRHRHGLPARMSSLVMLLQRSPVLPLLPEARIISTTGFKEVLQWSITAITGLGAYNSVTGASAVTQILPVAQSSVVNVVAGDSLFFLFQLTGETYIPAEFQVQGTLPPGLVQTGTKGATSDSITGVPQQAGAFPITIIAWELQGGSGFSARSSFTINVTLPPVPVITAQPAGGTFAAGSFVTMSVGHTSGRSFGWKLNNEALPVRETLLFARNGPRKFRTAPATNPGDDWHNLTNFDDSTWTGTTGGIGYDNDPFGLADFRPAFAPPGVDMRDQMFGAGKPAAVHLRMPFTISGPAACSYLKLRVQCDDGFVAWLNGTEIASQNKPSTNFQWNSAASSEAVDATAVNFRVIDLPQHLGLLKKGDNLLAVQAMNRNSSSPDFLFNCELATGIDTTNSARLILTNLGVSDTGNYTVTVANPAGSVTSQSAAVFMPTAIVAQPASVSIPGGTSTELRVTVSGSPPFSYQWYRGNSGDTSNPIAGATGDSFTTPALTATTSYWVRITSPSGTVDSSAAVVSVNAAMDPYVAWRNAHFSPEDVMNEQVAGTTADPDADGLTNEQEFVFGTLPLEATASPAPAITTDGNQVTLSFTAVRSSGPGYDGRNRLYTLESAVALEEGPWVGVASFIDIVANDQTVTYGTVPLPLRRYYRLKVRLTP